MNLLSRRQRNDETIHAYVVTFKGGVIRHFRAKQRDMLGHIAAIQHNGNFSDAINVQFEHSA